MLKTTTTYRYTVICDKCGGEDITMLTPEAAVLMARKHGWALDGDKAKCKRCMTLEKVG